MVLREARGQNLQRILMEGDALCTTIWVLGLCGAPWAMTNVVQEVVNLAKVLDASFSHVKVLTQEADRWPRKEFFI